MVELTVAEVSGLIAAGVFLLQHLLSVVFPVALVGFLGEENTVVTWSVLGRFLQSSPWPTLLRTDAAARQGVRRRVSNGLLLQTAIVVLVAVAAIVTPLGLYQTVEPADNQDPETFQYVQDTSPFGYGTPPRTVAAFTRNCGQDACPGSSMNETCVQEGRGQNCTNAVYDRSIPGVWKSTLTDGARKVNQSMSSIFDIQWRVQVNASDGFGSQGWYLKSGYRQIGIVVLDPGLSLVDGLIIDADNGGIGFRNHTVPVPVHEYGSTWTEDILFIEPETQCVDLNVTFDFSLSNIDTSRLVPSGLALKDRGGFSQLSRTSPDLSIPAAGNGQGPLDLQGRAYKAAWANNFLTLAYFNATDPDPSNFTRLDVTPGMSFHSSDSNDNSSSSSTTFSIEYQAIRSSLYFGEYLEFPDTSSSGNASVSSNSTDNPSRVSEADFDTISEICAGSTSDSPANINSSLVGCGLVYGAARRTDGGSELNPQPGSDWSVPVYSCAASIRASIRTVTFIYNGTGLAALNATAATPKTYLSPSETPVWAVENIHTTPLLFVQPLWGLLGTANATTPILPALANNLTTVHQPTLRLPGTVTTATPWNNSPDYVQDTEGQNLPGVDFYVQALQNAFSIARPGSPGYEGYADYSGSTSLALYNKWMTLSASAAGAAQIVNLVWTDIAANSVVGTKGWTSGFVAPGERSSNGGGGDRDNGGGESQVLVPVTPYVRRVRYRLAYATPAIVALGLAAAVVTAALVLLALGRTGADKVRRLLEVTSAGRLIGEFLWPAQARDAASGKTEEWVRMMGMKVVTVVAENGICEDDGDRGSGKGETKRAGTMVVRAVPDEGGEGDQEAFMKTNQTQATDES